MTLLQGMGYALRGFSLANTRGIRRFVLIPFLINITLFAGLIWLAADQFSTLMALMTDALPGWLDWLTWLLWPLFALSTALVLFYTFSTLANLVASPFNSLLAEKLEQRLTGHTVTGTLPLWDVVRSIGPSLRSELRKLGYFLVRAAPILILFLIPGLQIIAAPLWFLLGAWVLTIEYADYPMSNHNLPFDDQRRILGKNRMLSLGFGVTVMGMTLIPILNFITMPIAVCGATALWVERLRDQAQTR